jgi:hypothetical protein
MPLATAAAEPPDEPAGLSAGFQGLRVAPNTALTVWAPAANSGDDRARRLEAGHDLGILLGHVVLIERRAVGGADARGRRDVLDPDRQAGEQALRLAARQRRLEILGFFPRGISDERHNRIELRIDARDYGEMGVEHLERAHRPRRDQRGEFTRRLSGEISICGHLPDQCTKRRSMMRNIRLSP